MRYQEQIVKLTQKAVSDVIRAAEALPSDMREWSPAPEARSVMSQMQELAAASGWLLEIMQSRRMPEMSEDAKREIDDLVDQFHTFDDCVLGLKLGTAKLCDAIGAFPVEALEDEIVLPFGGGQTITMADAMGLHYWNLTYHLGQINYIQTCLGDMVMH
jgi:hypothetical protein